MFFYFLHINTYIVTYKKCAKTTATKTESSSSSSSITITTITSETTTTSSTALNSNNDNNNIDLPLSNTAGLTTMTAKAQQQTPTQTTLQTLQQHPLTVSMTSMSPSSNTSHPPRSARKEQGPVSAILTADKSITTVIQSIPSTIVCSRELERNPSQSSQLRGILKAPTPPPRPPPISRMVVASLKHSVSHVTPQKIEKVQSKIFFLI